MRSGKKRPDGEHEHAQHDEIEGASSASSSPSRACRGCVIAWPSSFTSYLPTRCATAVSNFAPFSTCTENCVSLVHEFAVAEELEDAAFVQREVELAAVAALDDQPRILEIDAARRARRQRADARRPNAARRAGSSTRGGRGCDRRRNTAPRPRARPARKRSLIASASGSHLPAISKPCGKKL